MTIPDGLPTLDKGAHGPGSGSACIMEFVSVLAGLEWTDIPECTLLPISHIAQRANDTIRDKDRHLLIPLIPRLIGTNPDDWTLRIAAAKAILLHLIDQYPDNVRQTFGENPARVKERVLHFEDQPDTMFRISPEAVFRQIDEATIRLAVTLMGAPCDCGICHNVSASTVQVLTEVLDAYDRFTGRGVDDMVPVTEQAMRDAWAVIA